MDNVHVEEYSGFEKLLWKIKKREGMPRHLITTKAVYCECFPAP